MKRTVTTQIVGDLGTRWTRRGAQRLADESNRGPAMNRPVEYRVLRVRLLCWSVIGYQAVLESTDRTRGEG